MTKRDFPLGNYLYNQKPSDQAGTVYKIKRFVVAREGKVRYDRELKVSATWESSFMGAVAVPTAGREYEGLYRKLVTTLLNDADFRAALSKN